MGFLLEENLPYVNVSYNIRLVIIKHALVKELLILQVQNDDIKPW